MIAYVRDNDCVRTRSWLRTYGIIIAYVRDTLRTYEIMIAYVRDHYCVRTGSLSRTYGIMIAYVRDHYCVRTGYIAYVRDHDSVRTGSLLRTYGFIIAYVRDNDCVRTGSLSRTYGILPLFFFLPMSPLGLRTFEQDRPTWKTLEVIALIRPNYWHEMRKIAIIFFQPLLNSFENLSLVTCITNLGGTHEKLFKISCPQVNINADADADGDDTAIAIN